MSDKTKKIVGWAIVSVAIIAAAFLGVNLPMPPPPVDFEAVMERSGVGQPIKFDRAAKFAQPVTMDQTLAVTGASTLTGAVTTAAGVSAASAEIGGGYGGGYSGGSGCTMTAAGGLSCDAGIYTRGTLGVTGNMTTTGTLDVGSTLNYGANNLYAVGHATTGKAIVAASAATAADGNITVASGLTSIDSAIVTVCQSPSAAPFATAIITTTTVTFNAWDVNRNNLVNGVTLCYMIIGTR